VFTKFMNGMYEIMPLAFGLVVTSIVFIIVDSLYFGSLNIVYDGKHEVTLENVMEVLNAPEKIASVRFTVSTLSFSNIIIDWNYLYF